MYTALRLVYFNAKLALLIINTSIGNAGWRHTCRGGTTHSGHRSLATHYLRLRAVPMQPPLKQGVSKSLAQARQMHANGESKEM